MIRLLYTTTIFASAALLFLVQPLFAKVLLPRFGGTTGVWSTCMVFFQAALLAGYGYANAAQRLPPRRQALLHSMLLLLPWLTLPIAAREGAGTNGENPIPRLLLELALGVGLPFLLVSTTAPLIQSWFGRTGDPRAEDPYFLYAASNAGSLLGLLAYPFIIERTLTLPGQSELWTAGYLVLSLLVVACAWHSARTAAPAADDRALAPPVPDVPLGAARQIRWLALSAVPSALLIAVTNFMTTDLFSVPLLWVIPLALLLLTFVNVFSRRPLIPHRLVVALSPVVLGALVAALALDWREPRFLGWILAGHLAAFFWVALLCHGELAQDRPERVHLTRFYLVMSLGGVLGGSFVALVAPLVFDEVLEYPLAVAAALLLLPGRGAALVARRAFAVAAIVFLAACLARRVADPRTIHTERSFFGVNRVTRLGREGASNRLHALHHGTTTHGRQRIDPLTAAPIGADEPIGYYFPGSPFSRYYAAVVGKAPDKRVGVIGLGAGSIAGHAAPGQTVVFYEIDEAVLRIAENRRLFTYLSAARERGATVETVLGDARLTLADDARRFDLLVVDAFTSDTIPLHLITREAIEKVYLPHVAEGGAIAFNISNRYLDLRPFVGDLAASLGLTCIACREGIREVDKLRGCDGAEWALIARDQRPLRALMAEGRWDRVPARAQPIVWTDASSDILSALTR
ncbi:MAG: spermidine synthase [Planctomycetota bacterium]